MLNRIARATTLVVLTALALLPIALKLVSLAFGVQFLSADLAQVNLVFVFAALAGVLTSAEGKQLSLAVLTERLPARARAIVTAGCAAIVAAVLTALFLASLSELFMAFAPGDKVWGIPLPLVFASLPAMYFAMIYLAFRRGGHLAATAVGCLVGVLIASGPIAGVAYSLFKIESLSPATKAFDLWMAVADKGMWPFVLLFVAAAALGVPLFVTLAGIAYVAFSQGGGYVEMIPLESYNILTDKGIAAIPLFTLAGYLLAEGSAGKRLLAVVNHSVGWLRGGAVIAAVLVATFFTTFTGASGVTILALGGLLTVILTGNGYSRENAESLVTASGAIGLLFPPSLAIIIYGTTNIFSVDFMALFKGAIIPGALLALGTIVLGVARDTSRERSPFSPKELGRAALNSLPELLLPAFIAIGYFSGFLSLIETASFTACYAFVLEAFVRRDFSLKDAGKIALKSVPVAGGVLVIIGAAKGLAYFMIDAGIPNMLTDFVMSFVHSKYVFLLLLNLLLLVVGCLMDLYSAILVVSPLIIPVAESFGIHPVHTGVIFLTNLALGFLTPPVGMNLFIASYTFERPIMRLVRSVMPYLLVQFAVLMLVTYVPWFSLVLL
ncbi:MAG TPA: TRAP transporter large permease subunit [Treponemataceae bacterium]|nr:TRAP transporter large permease subunit [Treponemataceae bacterium]